MNGFATTIISALLLVVAFMQWRTAHQKAVLDLFDKRFKVYDLVGRAMDIFYSASPLDTFIEARLLLQAASLEARFLFGPEISEHISSINRDIADLTFKLRKKDAADLDYTARNKLIEEIVIIGFGTRIVCTASVHRTRTQGHRAAARAFRLAAT